jgi:hypothetical protein
MPILDFGRTSARVDQAKAINQQSLIAWQDSLQTAYKEVRDALVSLREYGEAEKAQSTRVDRAEKAWILPACATKPAIPAIWKCSTPSAPATKPCSP